MKNLVFTLSLFILFSFNGSIGYAQTETSTEEKPKTVIITMNNGDEFRGEIVSQDGDRIILKTVNGELSLIAANVRSIVDDEYTGKYSFENPHDTRYFFGPSAIPIKKGKKYYQNVLVTANFFNYGLTENFSIGGGFEFISTLSGEPIWFLTPKIGFKVSDNVHIGGGFFTAGLAGEGSATLGYGVFTLGQSESNVSLTAGYGLADGEVTDTPVIVLSGTHRISNNIALLTENYFLPESSYFGIHGIRILSNKNAFDIGAIVIPEIADDIPALPYVGYVRVF